MKFAVIGTGRFGKHYVRLLRETEGVVLAATASRDTGNVEEIMNNADIEAVVLATPAETHFELVRKAVIAGKHVLVEKPMVLSVKEALAVRKLVLKSPKVFMVAHQYLYHDLIRFLKTEISKGNLGRIFQMSAECLLPGPVREDVGIFGDESPHEFAILDFLTGPAAVRKASGVRTDRVANAKISLDSGLTLEFNFSSVAEKKFRRRTFVGKLGRAVFDDSEGTGYLEIIFRDGREVRPQISVTEPLRSELEHFISCVKNHRTPLTDIEHALRVVRNVEKANEILSHLKSL